MAHEDNGIARGVKADIPSNSPIKPFYRFRLDRCGMYGSDPGVPGQAPTSAYSGAISIPAEIMRRATAVQIGPNSGHDAAWLKYNSAQHSGAILPIRVAVNAPLIGVIERAALRVVPNRACSDLQTIALGSDLRFAYAGGTIVGPRLLRPSEITPLEVIVHVDAPPSIPAFRAPWYASGRTGTVIGGLGVFAVPCFGRRIAKISMTGDAGAAATAWTLHSHPGYVVNPVLERFESNHNALPQSYQIANGVFDASSQATIYVDDFGGGILFLEAVTGLDIHWTVELFDV